MRQKAVHTNENNHLLRAIPTIMAHQLVAGYHEAVQLTLGFPCVLSVSWPKQWNLNTFR